jgi:xanthine/CO dehydrogenase XdhC/CoxF family maturation factor
MVDDIDKPLSYVLEVIDNFKKDGYLEREPIIILSSLYFDGTSKKRIIVRNDLPHLRLIFSSKLVDYISNIYNLGKSVGHIRLKDESGLEVIYIVEILQQLNSLIVLGAGHVGRSLSLIASILGFEVTLIDDREEFLRDENIYSYGVKKAFLSFNSYAESVPVASNSAIVIVTRGHQYDEICLRSAICTEAKYIGMIGSKRRVLAILNNLRRDNLTEKQLAKLENIYAPIGLDIGAKSPQEIAVSILAQIIKVMSCHSM